jgi:hypothetical protein
MRLILANFDGVFGLRGEICFTPRAPVILYAPNIAGKTNAITAIRMCFLGHKIFRHLRKDETILKPLKEGSISCYFSQWNRIFRLSYTFKRFGETIRRSCRLSSIPLIELKEPPEKIHQWLEAQSWKEEAKSPKEIKNRLEEIEVYPEIMGILLASSNIDGYLRAIEGEVCKIPEALSKQLTDVKNEADLNFKRMDKVKQELLSIEETQKTYLEQQKQHLKKVGVRPLEIKKLFTGKVTEKLEAYSRQINKRLARGIPEDTEKAMLAGNALKPLRKKLETIEAVIESIKRKKEFSTLLREMSKYRDAKERWSQVSEGLKAFPKDVWSLDVYVVPSIKKFNFKVFKDPSDIKALFKQIQEYRSQVVKAKKIASKYDIDSFSYLKRTSEESNLVLSQLKNPQELPKDTTPALICMLPKRRLPLVSVPIDKYQPKLAKVAGITTIHVPKDIPTQTLQKVGSRIVELERQSTELAKSLEFITEVEKELANVNKAIEGLTKQKAKELKDRTEEFQGKISEIQNEWNGKATMLYDHFNLGKLPLKFKEDVYRKDLEELQKKVKECVQALRNEIGQILSAFPRLKSKLMKKLETENFDAISKQLKSRVEKLEKERKTLIEIQKWIQKEAENVKKADHSLKCSRILLKKILPFAQIFYGLVFKLINLEEVVESLGAEMERNVETAYSSIFAEPTFRFTHIGKGLFTPKLDEQPITGPSGSQSAAVSFGILYTLADQYKLPLVMDEAADRFDPTRLANFMDLVKTVTKGTTEEEAKQICLAIYETRNISPEELHALNTYECVRVSNTEKRIRPYAVKI